MLGLVLSRNVLVGTVLVLGVATATVPAAADPSGPHTAWTHREDARAPGTGTTYVHTSDTSEFQVYAFHDQINMYSTSPAGTRLGFNFYLGGASMIAGTTYSVTAPSTFATTAQPQLKIWRDGTLCGHPEEDFPGPNTYQAPPMATGWLRIEDLALSEDDQVIHVSGTYAMSCGFIDGPVGFEGSFAVNAPAPPAPLPAEPETPGPITGLEAVNSRATGGSLSSSTLTWTNPTGYGDVLVEISRPSDAGPLPDLVGTFPYLAYRGTDARFHDRQVDQGDTRTYRIVPRGTNGRLGPPTVVTIKGTRLIVTPSDSRITIGEQVAFRGLLGEATTQDALPPFNVLKGSPVAGRVLVLCQQSLTHYVDADCTPVDRATTAADGSYTLFARPTANSRYSVVLAPASRMLANLSLALDTDVAPRTDLRAREGLRRTSDALVRRGAVIHFSTSRARAGSRGIVRLQRLDGRYWKTILTKRFGRGHGRLALPYREQRTGVHRYRVVKLADRHHVNGFSRIVRVQVR